MEKRKQIRLKDYDYSQNGYYFVTICTKDRKNIFYNSVVGADSISAQIVEKTFLETINNYQYVHCPIYVIMPNHFHCIIAIENEIERADIESAPTIGKVSLSQIIQTFKRYSTIESIKMVKQNMMSPFNGKIWQRGYYEHIIRNEHEYEEIYKYIYENPIKWEDDKYYN